MRLYLSYHFETLAAHAFFHGDVVEMLTASGASHLCVGLLGIDGQVKFIDERGRTLERG